MSFLLLGTKFMAMYNRRRLANDLFVADGDI